MREIITAAGDVIKVDADDYAELSKYTWYLSSGRNGAPSYPVRSVWEDKKVYMHRQITSPGSTDVVDHINRDKTDNRKQNLRVVGYSENEQNKPPYGSTLLKGVHKRKQTGKYICRITKDGKDYHLGYFYDKYDAARMYNFWAVDLYGEDAYVNKIPSGL